MKKRLYDWVAFIPETIAPEHRRAYYVALIAVAVAGMCHFLMLVLFAAFGITPLVYVNIGSVSLFAAAFFLVRRTGRAALGMVLMSVELIMHQVMAVYFLGWGYGFQYYLFLITSFAFLGHYRSRAVPAMCVLLSVAVFGWLYSQGQHLHLPHLSMPEPVRVGFFWWNVLTAMLALAAISLVYARTAARMQRELAEQNEELREAQLMLVQSEKMAAIGKLAAGLTHEINNPIGAILSNTQTGARAVERIRKQEEVAEATDDIGRRTARILDALGKSLESTAAAAQRLGELVGRLQGFVRIDEAEVKSVDLHDGIESALALLHNQTQTGPIEVICRFDRTIPEVLCRPAEINQVLMHLLQNAIDAIGGPGTITVTTSQDPERVMIAIRDTGRGLKPEEFEGLFDLSFSSSRSRVKLGMGLPVSHQIVVRHRGELLVDSAPGEGSTFTVVLPKQMPVD